MAKPFNSDMTDKEYRQNLHDLLEELYFKSGAEKGDRKRLTDGLYDAIITRGAYKGGLGDVAH